MKIGILTHHYVKNYGAFLQAKALYETVRQLYPMDTVKFINFIVPMHWLRNVIHVLHFNFKNDSLRSMYQRVHKLIMFSHYEHSLPRTRIVFSATGIQKLGFDLIIIGSDEVWDFEGTGYHPVKFGCGIDCARLIAYAPSAGRVSDTSVIPQKVYAGIQSFEKISVRDASTCALVGRITGYKPSVLCDPTFIYDYGAELHSVNCVIPSSPYILIYDCKLTDALSAALANYAREKGYTIIGISEPQPWFDHCFLNLSPYEWVSMFQNAALVLTGTFHGTVFSIKYQRPFICYPTEKNRIQKITSLLNTFSLEERLVHADSMCIFSALLDSPIDYPTDQRLQLQLDAAKSFLLVE